MKSKRKIMKLILLLQGVLFFGSLVDTGWAQYYYGTEVAWEKVHGMRPESVRASGVLYSGASSQGITSFCFDRCRRINCSAFVIDLERGNCFNVEPDTDSLVPEFNATFYHKIYLIVPQQCKRRLWQVERTLGAIFLDEAALWINYTTSRSQCYQECIKAGKNCKSAEFRSYHDLTISDAVGRCALSTYERENRPQCYRASMYRDEYLSTQCHTISKQDYCSYKEFKNLTLPWSDVKIEGLDESGCQDRCELNIDGIICRAFTVDRSYGTYPICLLHSDDSASVGLSTFVTRPNTVYREREPCIDMKVECNETSLTVELTTMQAFHGRIYASGYSDSCAIQGHGNNHTYLTLPLPSSTADLRNIVAPCGFTPAYSVDADNKSHAVIWTTVIVQFNPVVQRLGDQAVRVGCSLYNRTLPKPMNVTLNSNLSFPDPNAGIPPVGMTIVNTSSEVPVVSMRIFDTNNIDAKVTQLGQNLTMTISIIPADGIYDIFATHLLATSETGESSIILIDDNGCPTNPTTFPALSRDASSNRTLVANFSAFKFPNSQLVKFSVLVKFCIDKCSPAICQNDTISYGKKKRSADNPSEAHSSKLLLNIPKANATNVTTTPDQLSLDYSIIVHGPVTSPDPLQSNNTPDTILVAGEQSLEGLLCINAGLALGLLLLWLIIQIVLTGGCLYTVKKYKRMAREAEEDRADVLARHLYGIHGGNFEVSRRVRWADNGDSLLN